MPGGVFKGFKTTVISKYGLAWLHFNFSHQVQYPGNRDISVRGLFYKMSNYQTPNYKTPKKQIIELQNVESYKTSKVTKGRITKRRITKRRKLQKVEKQKVESNKILQKAEKGRKLRYSL